MDNETFRVIAVAIIAIAAVAAVSRGAILVKRGQKADGSRFMLIGAALMMLNLVVLVLRNGQ